MKRKIRGIAVATTLFGALIGSLLDPHVSSETHSHMYRVELREVGHANYVLGLALAGAIAGIAIDFRRGGWPLDRRDWQLGPQMLLLSALVFALLCFGLRCYWEILFGWP